MDITGGVGLMIYNADFQTCEIDDLNNSNDNFERGRTDFFYGTE